MWAKESSGWDYIPGWNCYVISSATNCACKLIDNVRRGFAVLMGGFSNDSGVLVVGLGEMGYE